MEKRELELVIKLLVDKVEMLEWELGNYREKLTELRKQHAELTEERDKLREECKALTEYSRLCEERNAPVALNVALEDEARNEVGI